MRTAKTLIRLGGCPGWSESSLGAHSFCWFFHVAGHFLKTDHYRPDLLQSCAISIRPLMTFPLTPVHFHKFWKLSYVWINRSIFIKITQEWRILMEVIFVVIPYYFLQFSLSCSPLNMNKIFRKTSSHWRQWWRRQMWRKKWSCCLQWLPTQTLLAKSYYK